MQHSTPQLTVIIPFLNRGELFRQTLDSISKQTEVKEPVNIILVDNGSTDNAPRVAKEWMENAPEWANVSLIHAVERGAAIARNKGLELCTTPWVMFFDSDDIMMHHHMSEVLHAINHYKDVDLIGWSVTMEGRDARYIKRAKLQRDDIDVVMHCVWATQRFVVKRDFLKQCGDWEESIHAWDDWELSVRMYLNHPKAVALPGMNSVKVIFNADSITGLNFSHKEGRWEKSIDAATREVKKKGRRDILFLIMAKKAILAADYKREGNDAACEKLVKEIRAEEGICAPLLSIVYLWRKKLVRGSAMPLSFLLKLNKLFARKPQPNQ